MGNCVAPTGNNLVTGHVVAACGMMANSFVSEKDPAKFDKAILMPIIDKFSIEPCSGKQNLLKFRKQLGAFGAHPLCKINVGVAMTHFKGCVGGWTNYYKLKRDNFFNQAQILLKKNGDIMLKTHEIVSIYDMFDLLDVDKSGELELGEWAVGLSLLFQGSAEEKITAAFQVIDKDSDGSISRRELFKYFQPFMNVIIPDEAEAIRPVMASKVTDEVHKEMLEKAGKKVGDGLLLADYVAFAKGTDVVLHAAEKIDLEIYNCWFAVHSKQQAKAIIEARKAPPQSPKKGNQKSRQASSMFLIRDDVPTLTRVASASQSVTHGSDTGSMLKIIGGNDAPMPTLLTGGANVVTHQKAPLLQ